MSAASIAGAIAVEQGWTDRTLLALCLDYIENQQSNAAFEDYLWQRASTDDEGLKVGDTVEVPDAVPGTDDA